MFEAPSVFRVRLIDLFVATTIVALVMGGSLTVHRWMLNGPNAYWRELSQELRHLLPTPVSLFRNHAVHWALFHVGCALCCWIVLRQLTLERRRQFQSIDAERQRIRNEIRPPLPFDRPSNADGIATVLLGFGYAIPVLSAPIVPMWDQPGFVAGYSMLICLFAGILARRFIGAGVLLLTGFAWFYLSFVYALSIWD